MCRWCLETGMERFLKGRVQVVKEWVAGKFCWQRDEGDGYGVNPATSRVLCGFPRARWQRVPGPSATRRMALRERKCPLLQVQHIPFPPFPALGALCLLGFQQRVPLEYPLCLPPACVGTVGCCSVTADWKLAIGFFCVKKSNFRF